MEHIHLDILRSVVRLLFNQILSQNLQNLILIYLAPVGLFMTYFVSFLGITTCSQLIATYDCASETNAVVTGSSSLADCPSSCSQEANGRHGCCEWQADWKKCMFIPGVKSEPSRTSGERHAIDCVPQGL